MEVDVPLRGLRREVGDGVAELEDGAGHGGTAAAVASVTVGPSH